ncbi:MAG: GNAT family N-acetyltransferase, partial [bacterium]|nr:GNAT family N-acetyltransferase [bacterium]
MSEPNIVHNESASRFELHLDGQVVGLADYFDDEDTGVREFPHTEVDPSLQGRGLAGRLVGHALKETRSAGLKAEPTCPYVAAYIKR